MNEKPQESRGNEREDLLEQIITQELEKMNTPTQTAAAEETLTDEADPTPGQTDSEKAAPPTDRKSKRSSVYLYLLILFGAAFMMLLLAYFVQRRSNENTISDLRDSMNLSREQLLAEISDLKEQNEALSDENKKLKDKHASLNTEIAQLQDRYNEQVQDAIKIFGYYYDALSRLNGWENYWLLEQSYQAGKYEDCVAILLLADMTEFGSHTPNKEIADRREEIIQTLVDRDLFPEDRQIRISDYQDLIDAYLAEHPDYGPTGWANVVYD